VGRPRNRGLFFQSEDYGQIIYCCRWSYSVDGAPMLSLCRLGKLCAEDHQQRQRKAATSDGLETAPAGCGRVSMV
jgi:hypothetical protein